MRVFDRRGRKLAVLATGATGSFLNDVWGGDDVAAYVTDSALPLIWRVSERRGEWRIERWLDLSGTIAYTPVLTDFDLGGIVTSKDPPLTTQGTTGQLWRICSWSTRSSASHRPPPSPRIGSSLWSNVRALGPSGRSACSQIVGSPGGRRWPRAQRRRGRRRWVRRARRRRAITTTTGGRARPAARRAAAHADRSAAAGPRARHAHRRRHDRLRARRRATCRARRTAGLRRAPDRRRRGVTCSRA